MTASYDRAAFETAHERLRHAPGELTPSDLLQLAAFSPELGREALAARAVALYPAPAPAVAPGPVPAMKSGLSPEAIDAIAEGVVTFVAEQVRPILRRLDVLEQQPPSPQYHGTFEPGKSYGRGALVTRSGGLWLALENTTQVPGRSDTWRLVVKSGEARR